MYSAVTNRYTCYMDSNGMNYFGLEGPHFMRKLTTTKTNAQIYIKSANFQYYLLLKFQALEKCNVLHVWQTIQKSICIIRSFQVVHAKLKTISVFEMFSLHKFHLGRSMSSDECKFMPQIHSIWPVMWNLNIATFVSKSHLSHNVMHAT